MQMKKVTDAYTNMHYYFIINTIVLVETIHLKINTICTYEICSIVYVILSVD